MKLYDDSKFMFEKQFMVDARDQYVDGDVFVDLPSQNIPLSRWTEVSNDDRLMNHLLRMFWAWDNIVERTLYRPILEEDVVAMDPLLDAAENPGSFCSRFLVNSLLALSCLYTMDVATFKDPRNSVTRGRSWADEADALLATIDKPSIPLLQGLLALFCYEGNLGSGVKAISCYYLRAMETYKLLNELDFPQHRAGVDEDRIRRERQAASWCLWGFYCCEWRGTQALGYRKMTRKPRAPRVWREPDFPLSLPNSSGHWWFPYPMSLRVQRSMKVEIREVDAKLSEIVEEALDFIYPAEGEAPPSSDPQRAMELYDAIIDWKLSLPSRLRLEEAVLPSVILLHISAEVILTAILRPFSHMSKENFGRFDPKERCFTHASSLTSSIWTFRAFSYIRFEYWLTHATSTAGYIVVSEAHDPIHLDTLIRACQCLHEMRVSLPIATDLLCGIHAAFKRYKMPVSEHVKKYFNSLHHRKEGLMHHAIAALLPQGSGSGAEVQVQELLNGLDDLKID